MPPIGSDGNTGDLHLGEVLPVTVLALETLAPLELENDELLAAAVPDDLRRDFGAFDQRLPDGRGIATDREHLVKNNIRSRVAREAGEAQDVPFGDAELLSAGSYDCAGHWGAGT